MNWLSLLIKLKGKPTNQVQWFPDFTIEKNILVTLKKLSPDHSKRVLRQI